MVNLARTLASILGLGLISMGTTGCFGHGAGRAAGRLLAEGLVTGLEVAAVAAASHHESDPDPDPPASAVFVNPAPDPTFTAPPFDLVAARAALRDADLASCKSSRPVWGHASVTFGPTGRVETVVIDEPATLTDETTRCIGARLGATEIPEYAGNEVVVGIAFHIES